MPQAVTRAACAYSQPSVKRAKLLEPTRTPLSHAHKDVLRLFNQREPAPLRVPSSPRLPPRWAQQEPCSSCQAAQGCCSCHLLPFLFNTRCSGSRLKWNIHTKIPTENILLKFPVIVSLGCVSASISLLCLKNRFERAFYGFHLEEGGMIYTQLDS